MYKRVYTPQPKTSNYTILKADMNADRPFTNTGATGSIVLTLPDLTAVLTTQGAHVVVEVTESLTITITPDSGEKIDNLAADVSLSSSTIGSRIHLVGHQTSGQWCVLYKSGTWA